MGALYRYVKFMQVITCLLATSMPTVRRFLYLFIPYTILAMNNIVFDEQHTSRPRHRAQAPFTGLSKVLQRLFPRLIKTKRDANVFLLFIFVCCLVVIIFFWQTSGTTITTGGPGPTQAELEAYRKIQPY